MMTMDSLKVIRKILFCWAFLKGFWHGITSKTPQQTPISLARTWNLAIPSLAKCEQQDTLEGQSIARDDICVFSLLHQWSMIYKNTHYQMRGCRILQRWKPCAHWSTGKQRQMKFHPQKLRHSPFDIQGGGGGAWVFCPGQDIFFGQNRSKIIFFAGKGRIIFFHNQKLHL